MKPSKKPKYKFNVKKFVAQAEAKHKQEKDWSVEDLYKEQLRSKSRFKRR
jgi:hypothetical protein